SHRPSSRAAAPGSVSGGRSGQGEERSGGLRTAREAELSSEARLPPSLLILLQEQQERQLLDVVAVGQPIVAEDVAVVPELLNDLLGVVTHLWTPASPRSRSTPCQNTR